MKESSTVVTVSAGTEGSSQTRLNDSKQPRLYPTNINGEHDRNSIKHQLADLDTVEDGAHDAGTELDGQGLSAPQDGVADGQAGSVLVHLKQRTKNKKVEEATLDETNGATRHPTTDTQVWVFVVGAWVDEAATGSEKHSKRMRQMLRDTSKKHPIRTGLHITRNMWVIFRASTRPCSGNQ